MSEEHEHDVACDTKSFLRSLQSCQAPWDSPETEEGFYALARKCDIAHKLFEKYEEGWKRPLSKEEIDPEHWAIFIEALFTAVRGVTDRGRAVRLLNTAANAISALQEIAPADAGQWEKHWDTLADGVCDERA